MLLPAPQRKKRNALRFLAGTCVFSGWATLVVSVICAVGLFLAGTGMAASSVASPSPSPFPSGGGAGGMPGGLEGLGLPGGGSGMPQLDPIGMLRPILAAMWYGSAVFTLVTGVITFLLFLGLGQACYVLLDLEEQTFRITDALQVLVARLRY